MVKTTPRSLHTLGKEPVPFVHEAGDAPLPVRTGSVNLTSLEIRSPDLPVRSESLYRLRYHIPQSKHVAAVYNCYSQLAPCRAIFLLLCRVSQGEWAKLRESVPYVEL